MSVESKKIIDQLCFEFVNAVSVGAEICSCEKPSIEKVDVLGSIAKLDL